MIYPDIFRLHPLPAILDREVALRCIAECLDCIAGCTACADDCLGEPDLPDMVRCVRLDLDCADICWAFSGVSTTMICRLTFSAGGCCAVSGRNPARKAQATPSRNISLFMSVHLRRALRLLFSSWEGASILLQRTVADLQRSVRKRVALTPAERTFGSLNLLSPHGSSGVNPPGVPVVIVFSLLTDGTRSSSDVKQ